MQESKFVWRWDKKQVPRAVENIIEEKRDNLRGRRFIVPRQAKQCSIVSRLNKRASASISTISTFKTKKCMSKRLKNTILESYSFVCRRRVCFVCNRRVTN